MLYAKTKASKAESVRRMLMGKGLLSMEYLVMRKAECVYFPLVSLTEKDKKLIESEGLEIARAGSARRTKRAPSYGSAIRSMLDDKEMGLLSKGYDQYGSIATIDIGESLGKKEKLVANAIMDSNSSIRTVVAKAGPVHGAYRTRDYRYIAGKRTFIAEHRENGCTFRFDVRKAFFSNRLSYERSRVRALSRPKENVMVMFAGVGPFAIEIAKAHKDSRVVAVELNRDAYKYMLENIRLNKTGNVEAVLGDVKDLPKTYNGFSDRIIAPPPQKSLEFLDEIFRVARDRAAVHIYVFGPKKSVIGSTKEAIRAHAKKHGCKVRFISVREARPYSASDIEIALDFEIRRGHGHMRVSGT